MGIENFDHAAYIEQQRDCTLGMPDVRLRARLEELPEDASLEAEIISEETRTRFAAEIDTWLKSGLLSKTSAPKIEFATRGELVVFFSEFVKRFSEYSAIHEEDSDEALVRMANLPDVDRESVLTQLFGEYGDTINLFSVRLSNLAAKPTMEFLLRESPAVIREIRKNHPHLSERKIAAEFKKRPTNPTAVEDSFGYHRRVHVETQVSPEATRYEAVTAEALVSELKLPLGNQKFYFLPGDVGLVDKSIEELNEKYRQVQQDMQISVQQTSESWHDNFGFEQGKRDLEVTAKRRSRSLSIRKGVAIGIPANAGSEVNLGMRVFVEDIASGKKAEYFIGSYVPSEEAISYHSPLGRLLLGAKEGEVRSGKTGTEARSLRIERIIPAKDFEE